MMSHYHKHNPLMQIVWEPYTHTLGSLLAYCTAGQHIWRAEVPLIYFWILEGHHSLGWSNRFHFAWIRRPTFIGYPSKVNGTRIRRQNMLPIFSNGPTEGNLFALPLSWTVIRCTLLTTWGGTIAAQGGT